MLLLYLFLLLCLRCNLQLEINLEPIKVNKNFILYLQSNIIKKNILVPKSSAITILKDICFILSNVDKKFNI